jgi:hypothetical protein
MLLLAAAALFAALLFGRLSHPLLWHDEAETAVFARRVLEVGYPKVHGPGGTLYEFGSDAFGVKQGPDAYVATTWGHFYFAAPGAAWAQRTRDLYAQTFRLRLPFALAGALGVAVLALAALPVHAGRPRRQALFAALFLLLSSLSISLVLHLREVRYYPLVVLLGGAILALHLRCAVLGRGWRARDALALALLLVLLFNCFWVAWAAFSALLAADGLRRAWRARGAGGAAVRRALAGPAAVALSLLAVAPLLAWFETFRIGRDFAERLGPTPGAFAANLGFVLRHFLRHELLAPALALRLAALGWEARARARGAPRLDPASLACAGFLSAFAVGYALLLCTSPLVYERYFVLLGPVLSLVFLLDAFALAEGVPRALTAGRRRAARRLLVLAPALLAAASAAVRLPELRGRLEEIARPYRGPLDFAIAHLRAAYPDPASLVVATNYSPHVYRWYLRCTVVGGQVGVDPAQEAGRMPDVVIPRRRWPRGQAELWRLVARGGYARRAFPVEDRHFNNTPALTRTPAMPDPHRFRTPIAEDPRARLALYELRASLPRG